MTRQIKMVRKWVASLMVLGFLLVPAVSFAEDKENDNTCHGPCGKVLEDAKQIPAPSPKAIYDYGKRNVDNIKKCLDCAIDRSKK